jgi:hypothetical protein
LWSLILSVVGRCSIKAVSSGSTKLPPQATCGPPCTQYHAGNHGGASESHKLFFGAKPRNTFFAFAAVSAGSLSWRLHPSVVSPFDSGGVSGELLRPACVLLHGMRNGRTAWHWILRGGPYVEFGSQRLGGVVASKTKKESNCIMCSWCFCKSF